MPRSASELNRMLEGAELEIERLMHVVREARGLVGEDRVEVLRAYLISEDLRMARERSAALLRDVQESLDLLVDAIDARAGEPPRDTGVVSRSGRHEDATG